MATVFHSRTSSILLPSPSSSSASYSSRQHIRFAPLPDPRDDTTTSPKYSTEQCDPDPPTEDILVSSSSSSSSSQLSSSTTSTPHISCDLDKSSPDSSVGSSPVTPLTALPQKFPPTTHNSPVPPSPQVSWVKKPHISLLRPFKRFSTSSSGSSSHTLTPTPSIDTPRRSITKEDVLTLGTVNLFRTTSRESSRNSRDDDSLWSLSRWSSLGSSSSNIPGSSSPSLRNQSNQSLVSQSSSRFPTFSSSSSSSSSDSKTNPKAKPPPIGQQPRTNKYKGTRMLNGRVYGAPKRNANPFANARDEEPEFVEWGYGGMGSVKGAKSAGVGNNWERLQSGSIDVGVGGVGAGIGAGDAELDDGSGLAWVKRRKEERERKAKEQKEKEEKELAESESQTSTPIPTRSPTAESLPTLASPLSAIESATHTAPTIDIPPLSVVLENEDGETANFATSTQYPSELSVSPTLQTEDAQSKPEEGHVHNTHENERVLQAITIPVRSPRHHHHRQPSKSGSREVLVPPSTDGPAALVQIVESPSTTGSDTTDAPTNASHTSTMELDKSTSFSSSSSESESEFEGGFDDDSDDEEEEEEQESQKQNGRRKSALGTAAGVEKISRHKE